MWKNPHADSKRKGFFFKTNKKEGVKKKMERKEMLSDSAQLAMYGHLATKWERPTTFKAGAEVPHPV